MSKISYIAVSGYKKNPPFQMFLKFISSLQKQRNNIVQHTGLLYKQKWLPTTASHTKPNYKAVLQGVHHINYYVAFRATTAVYNEILHVFL